MPLPARSSPNFRSSSERRTSFVQDLARLMSRVEAVLGMLRIAINAILRPSRGDEAQNDKMLCNEPQCTRR